MADLVRLYTFVVGQPIKKVEVDAELDQIIARLNDIPLDSLSSAVAALLVPTGTILATGRSTADTGYLLCDGAAVSRTGQAALFAAIGTAYGVGDGVTTFNLPDLRGRAPIGVDGAAGRIAANDALGNAAGAETHTLTTAQIPAHTHGLGIKTANDGTTVLRGSPGPIDATIQSDPAGGGTAHNNLQPYQVVNYQIKL